MVYSDATIRIFIAYARKDAELERELYKQLIPLIEKGVEVWHDKDIEYGKEWNKEIVQELGRADIVLLLVSSDALTSKYFKHVEVKKAFERRERGECAVLSVILRSCVWKHTSLSKYQALPLQPPTNELVPVQNWRNVDDAFLQVAEAVLEEAERIRLQRIKAFVDAVQTDEERKEVIGAGYRMISLCMNEGIRQEIEQLIRQLEQELDEKRLQGFLKGAKAALKNREYKQVLSQCSEIVKDVYFRAMDVAFRREVEAINDQAKLEQEKAEQEAAFQLYYKLGMEAAENQRLEEAIEAFKEALLYQQRKNAQADLEEEEPDIEEKIVSPEDVFVSGGIFTMGCQEPEEGGCFEREKPAHRVALGHFHMMKYPVTNSEYCTFLNEKGNKDRKGNSYLQLERGSGKIKLVGGMYRPKTGYGQHPVVYVSWHGAVAYADWLSEITRSKFRLPTEAEWEYAARGGIYSKGHPYSGGKEVSELAWYDDNTKQDTEPVGKKLPNELGLYDMSGNVWEWCGDWYGQYTKEAKTNPKGSDKGVYRVIRGGSWDDFAIHLRVSARYWNVVFVEGSHNIGFRLVREL